MPTSENSPIELLRQLENASLGNLLDDPAAHNHAIWRGFVFHIDELNLAVPFAAGRGIMPLPKVSPLPMTRPWVVGMACIHGEIHTLVDFAGFIGRRAVDLNARCNLPCNLLVLPDIELKSALLLGGGISLRSFSSEPQPPAEAGFDSGLDSGLVPYLSGVVGDGDERWGVIDIDRLCGCSEFEKIGA